MFTINVEVIIVEKFNKIIGLGENGFARIYRRKLAGLLLGTKQ